jgi:hypothetical protein
MSCLTIRYGDLAVGSPISATKISASVSLEAYLLGTKLSEIVPGRYGNPSVE